LSSLRSEQHRPKAIFPLRSCYLTLLLQTLIMNNLFDQTGL
jgi:hypothetical protein